MRCGVAVLLLPAALLLLPLLATAGRPAVTPANGTPARGQQSSVGGGGALKSFVLDASGVSPARLEAAARGLGGQVTFHHQGSGIAAVKVPSGVDPTGALRAVGVSEVAEDTMVTLQRPKPVQVSAAQQRTFKATGDSSVAADPSLPTDFTFTNRRAWNLEQIGAPSAWRRGITGKCVRVAVLEGGVDRFHVDLVDRIDVEYSRSFVQGFDDWADDESPFLQFRSATTVAGVIAASSNGQATVGVAHEATIIAIKVLQAEKGWDSDFVQGILYAATPIEEGGAGAHIIHVGVVSEDVPKNGSQSKWPRALSYAARNGVLVVAPADNRAVDLDKAKPTRLNPCEAANSLCVSATGPIAACTQCYDVFTEAPVCTDFENPRSPPFYRLSIESNYGNSAIWVAAPGGEFAGQLEGNECWLFSLITIPYGPTDGVSFSNGGTTYAAAHVSGLAALLLHHDAIKKGVDMCSPGFKRNSLISAGAIKAAIARGAWVPEELKRSVGTAQLRSWFGHGVIDVPRTLDIPYVPVEWPSQ